MTTVQMTKGQRLQLAPLLDGQHMTAGMSIAGAAIDFACFGLNAVGRLAGENGKLLDERYMTFFNQPVTPCGGVTSVQSPGDAQGFAFDLGAMGGAIDRVVITASLEGAGSLSQISSGYLRLIAHNQEFARFDFSGAEFAGERAVMLGELYRRDGSWRFMAVGQGFDGGLDALVRHFGGAVAETPAAHTTLKLDKEMEQKAPKLKLDKDIEQKAPKLINLVKSAGVSLAKVGLTQHRAKVCLVLDISVSMVDLYQRGLVQSFAERILAIACKFDDDGELDVFLFGKNVHHCEPMSLANWDGYIANVLAKHRLEGDTRYGAAIKSVRQHYFPDSAGGERLTVHRADVPVYAMFVTDGATSDQPVTEQQLRWASREPIFWQFMGIGKGKKSKFKVLARAAESDFPFLEKLDELDGRLIDNANYFSVASPTEHADSELYDLLMSEYPQWLALARSNGMLG